MFVQPWLFVALQASQARGGSVTDGDDDARGGSAVLQGHVHHPPHGDSRCQPV